MWVKKNSLSYFILLALEKTVDGYIRFEDFAYHAYRYRWGIPKLKQSEFSQALKRLRERGLVTKDITNTNEIILKLTDLGREVLGHETEEEWDGKWRIVIFDIPEEKRIIRNLFRRRLKGWGFKKWQQSVWITKKNVSRKIRLLIHDLKIEDWIAVIESEDTSIGNRLLDGRIT
ncbi:hypothetical protein KKE03_03410 [Patescibacteria group bacterium]|nr:hypothetical protein [Patescibacteria group bacterium]